MLPSMISNYNERSAKQYEINIAETLPWNFIGTNDQSHMPNRLQLSQAETNINEILSETMPKYKEQREMENNGRLNSEIHDCDIQWIWRALDNWSFLFSVF